MEIIDGGNKSTRKNTQLGARIHQENGKYIATGIDYSLSCSGATELEAMQNLKATLEYLAAELEASPELKEALNRLRKSVLELKND